MEKFTSIVHGGGVNYLCLPHSPKYDKFKDGYQNSVRMYGSEYEVNTVNPFKKNLHDHDAPCVVCYVSSRGSMLMMPARNDCPSGWTEEYHGYLMTEFYNHPKQRDFICVDEDAEYVAVQTRTAPCCTLWRASVGHSRVFRMSLVVS